MAEQRGSRRDVVSPYLLRPRRSIEEVMVQRRRPAAAAVEFTAAAEPSNNPVSVFPKNPTTQE